MESLLRALPPRAEVLVVDDWSTDGSANGFEEGGFIGVLRPPKRQGTVKARNYGARHPRGQVIVFSDAHVEVPDRWFGTLLAPLARPSVGAVGPAICRLNRRDAIAYGLRFRDGALNCEWGGWMGPKPHPVAMLGVGFFAMRRAVFAAIGGFDPEMIMFGMEDPDLDTFAFGHSGISA